MADALKKRWRKILYEDQGVSDNYVDESFLDEMRKNLYIRNYDYWTVVKGSGEITLQISSVCIFAVTYIYMSEKILSPETLVAMTTLSTIVGYGFKKLLDYKSVCSDQSKRTVLDDMKTFILFMGFSYGLSPVLVSLTETISTDTIYAMTTMMLLANLLFHNYGADSAIFFFGLVEIQSVRYTLQTYQTECPVNQNVSEALSLNAGIFASVCLASRLHTSWHSFAMVTFSLQIFGLWPMLRHQIKDVNGNVQIMLSVVIGTVVTIALASISVVSAVLFVCGYVFITIICPSWLISLQPYKNNIYGPWDEAVIKPS